MELAPKPKFLGLGSPVSRILRARLSDGTAYTFLILKAKMPICVYRTVQPTGRVEILFHDLLMN